MVTREELNGKTHGDIQAILQDDLEAYKLEIDSIDDKETLLEFEKNLMVDHDTFQAQLKVTNYALGDNVVFEGEEFKKSKVADDIAYFLNKHEVEWSYTLGMYQLVQLWRSADLNQISYEAYDSTLRLLNQTKFKGYSEWRDILVVNEYLSSCHFEYVKDTSYMIYLAQKHNTIMDRLKLISPDTVQAE